ncbi:hypothetical protein [Nonomuraea jabiensis]|uniref:hypothetical protein n=1 Tax=Nonomuraea jabiensis TaxID=882448 RepID=UPI0036A515B1
MGRKRVARLMRAAGLAGVSWRKGCRTTIADRQAVAPSDLVKRKFTAAKPNRVWTALNPTERRKGKTVIRVRP